MVSFESAILPVLPLRDVVVFPNSISPLFVMRPTSLTALDKAVNKDKRIFVVCQKDMEKENPEREDLYDVGTVAQLLQVLNVPDGSTKILVEGLHTARIVDFMTPDKFHQALVVRTSTDELEGNSAQAYMRTSLNLFEKYARFSDKVPEDLFNSIRNLSDPLALVHAIANYASIKTSEKQRILEASNIEDKFLILNTQLEQENEILELEEKIVTQVKDQIGRNQREYFLKEQLGIIERELGMAGEDGSEISELQTSIWNSGMPEETREKAEKELNRLSRMPSMSPEATVSRTYIEWLIEMPWQLPEEIVEVELAKAREILDKDHYGLEKIKKRILEYLAVTKHAGKIQGPILCFVGPPGVGKTSLGKSIAKCMGLDFVRVSLGGVRDEAEIRGHRRTYIGAMPGKIIQSMKRAGAINPVFMLDELDKMSSDFRGDPASALLEVLDPEQNKNFVDHYLEVDYDLSHTLFVATANTTEGIPLPLLDRMEIIRLPGYTDIEKLEISKRHLIPKVMKAHGLRRKDLSIHMAALRELINGYTREAGVRNLEREIQAICRKVVSQIVAEKEGEKDISIFRKVTGKELSELLGPAKFRDQEINRTPEVGIGLGLAWTSVGGELLPVEVLTMPGKGNLTLTGKLGDVMKESAQTALSYIRGRAAELDIDVEDFSKLDIHVHVPEGAIPKDGPSAGITLATAMASALSKKPVRQDIAMTGEITLRGHVLKIGGLKEKSLAAYRNKLKQVIIPDENLSDLHEIPTEVKKALEFHPVKSIMEVFEIALNLDKQKKPKKKSSNPSSKTKRKQPTRRQDRPVANISP